LAMRKLISEYLIILLDEFSFRALLRV